MTKYKHSLKTIFSKVTYFYLSNHPKHQEFSSQGGLPFLVQTKMQKLNFSFLIDHFSKMIIKKLKKNPNERTKRKRFNCTK